MRERHVIIPCKRYLVEFSHQSDKNIPYILNHSFFPLFVSFCFFNTIFNSHWWSPQRSIVCAYLVHTVFEMKWFKLPINLCPRTNELFYTKTSCRRNVDWVTADVWLQGSCRGVAYTETREREGIQSLGQICPCAHHEGVWWEWTYTSTDS